MRAASTERHPDGEQRQSPLLQDAALGRGKRTSNAPSARELEVLALTAEGNTEPEIARWLPAIHRLVLPKLDVSG